MMETNNTNNPVAEGTAVRALRDILHRASQASQTSSSSSSSSNVRVVAVSKTKPVSMIQDVYDAGHRHFGENYVQELLEKAPQLPNDIKWHFIGHLQSNKAKALVAGVPNLFMVETVDNTKVANNLDKAVEGLERPPLNVLVQVNTSGEESKYGVEPSACSDLAKHVKFQCPHLKFSGLMTIGMPDYTSCPENFKVTFFNSKGFNQVLKRIKYTHQLSFKWKEVNKLIKIRMLCSILKPMLQTLFECRQQVSKELGIPEEELELSMGMSGDFEQAIEMGSTNVRIGSTIFGSRDYSSKKN